MADIFYSKDHEYIRMEGELGTVGITDYAQDQLGDIVFVELPEIGKGVQQGDEAAVVESVKAASEVIAPVSGEVIDANAELSSNPALVNEDPEGKGWFLKIKLSDKNELSNLMGSDSYQAYLKEIA